MAILKGSIETPPLMELFDKGEKSKAIDMLGHVIGLDYFDLLKERMPENVLDLDLRDAGTNFHHEIPAIPHGYCNQ